MKGWSRTPSLNCSDDDVTTRSVPASTSEKSCGDDGNHTSGYLSLVFIVSHLISISYLWPHSTKYSSYIEDKILTPIYKSSRLSFSLLTFDLITSKYKITDVFHFKDEMLIIKKGLYRVTSILLPSRD